MNDIIERLEHIEREIERARDIAYKAPEIDMKSVDKAEVKKLDSAMMEVFEILNTLYHS